MNYTPTVRKKMLKFKPVILVHKDLIRNLFIPALFHKKYPRASAWGSGPCPGPSRAHSQSHGYKAIWHKKQAVN
jgi:hypothetical protein